MADPMEVSVKDFPTIYDVSTDSYRPATQEDVNQLMRANKVMIDALRGVREAMAAFDAMREALRRGNG
jgi:hypothetical protein